VVLSGLLAYILTATPGAAEDKPLKIEVVGEQWWWRVRYLDDAGKADFVTANELRIPVGRTVELSLASADVIHSFWVPSLAGKVDMLPGRTNRLRLAAERAGVFRGQCAEYCGGPHALMALHVVAETAEGFELWRQAQRRPAASHNALFNARCAVCHTVRGTPAAGTHGPDLTHVGSRMFIGAGLLPTNAGALAGWIASSQHLKPGNLMPEFKDLRAEELRALGAYLESLK
jgi:cytochrome c oxidase subunit II